MKFNRALNFLSRIERKVTHKKTGKTSGELVYGVTSGTLEGADPAQVLALNRNHWVIEDRCHYLLDWNWDEDRSTIRTGHGPENISRLRRFAIGVIKAISRDSVAATLRKLHRNIRLVFDYLRMTRTSQPKTTPRNGLVGRTNQPCPRPSARAIAPRRRLLSLSCFHIPRNVVTQVEQRMHLRCRVGRVVECL